MGSWDIDGRFLEPKKKKQFPGGPFDIKSDNTSVHRQQLEPWKRPPSPDLDPASASIPRIWSATAQDLRCHRRNRLEAGESAAIDSASRPCMSGQRIAGLYSYTTQYTHARALAIPTRAVNRRAAPMTGRPRVVGSTDVQLSLSWAGRCRASCQVAMQ